MIKVAIVDDIKNIRESIKEKINLSPDIKVEKTYASPKKLIEDMEKGFEPDVILMDIEMPEMNGIIATEIITTKFPKTKVLMFTVFDDHSHLFNAVCVGAKGYLLKDEKPEKIHRAIFETMEGGSSLSPHIAIKALDLIKKNQSDQMKKQVKKNDILSEREMEMLKMVADGLTGNEIADKAGISYGTVRKHMENIYLKLGVHNKVDALNRARKEGWI
ncbi:MAG: response regulator transcription factor [Bacteroidia bacterium]|nr:response regulator transcription factor [Bacteroidia bacterium]